METKRNQGKLFKANGVWVLQDSDPLIKDLFGTDTLPTPYRACAPVTEVLTEMQARLPSYDLTIVEES